MEHTAQSKRNHVYHQQTDTHSPSLLEQDHEYGSTVLHAAPAKHLRRLPKAAPKSEQHRYALVPGGTRSDNGSSVVAQHTDRTRSQRRVYPNKKVIEAVSEMIFPSKLRKHYSETTRKDRSSCQEIQQANSARRTHLVERPLDTRLANHVGESDFLAPSSYFKSILKAPFTDEAVSLSLHRIGGTILVEAPPSRDQYKEVFEGFVSGVRRSLVPESKLSLKDGQGKHLTNTSSLDMQTLDHFLFDNEHSSFVGSPHVSPGATEDANTANFVVRPGGNVNSSKAVNEISHKTSKGEIDENMIRGILEYSNREVGIQASYSDIVKQSKPVDNSAHGHSAGDRNEQTWTSADPVYANAESDDAERSTILLRAPSDMETDCTFEKYQQAESSQPQTTIVSNTFPPQHLDGREIDAIANASAEKQSAKYFTSQNDSVKKPTTTPASLRKYQRVTRWKFGSHSIVLGSDLMTFCNDPDSGIMSLALRDTSIPLSMDECLDLYLENELAGVSEVAFCYHSAGNIQGYELVPTSHVLHLATPSNSTNFSEETFKAQAKELLDFLRVNCSEDNGSYWLLKEAGESVLRLYTLSSEATNPARRRKWRYMLAMMCYRFAKQIDEEIDSYSEKMKTSSSQYLSALYTKRGELLRRCSSLLLELEEEMEVECAEVPRIGKASASDHEKNPRQHRQQNAFMRAAIHQELAENRLCAGIASVERTSKDNDSKRGIPVSIQYLNEALRHIFASLQLFAEGICSVLSSSLASSVVALRNCITENVECSNTELHSLSHRIAKETLERPQLSDCMEKTVKLRKQIIQVALLISRAFQKEAMPRLGLRSLNDAVIVALQPLGAYLQVESLDEIPANRSSEEKHNLFDCDQLLQEVLKEIPTVLREESDDNLDLSVSQETFQDLVSKSIYVLREQLDSSASIVTFSKEILPSISVTDSSELLDEDRSNSSHSDTFADVELLELVGDLMFTLASQEVCTESQNSKVDLGKFGSLKAVMKALTDGMLRSLGPTSLPEDLHHEYTCSSQVQESMNADSLLSWPQLWDRDNIDQCCFIPYAASSYLAAISRHGAEFAKCLVRCYRKYADTLNRYGSDILQAGSEENVWTEESKDSSTTVILRTGCPQSECLKYFAEAARAFDKCGDSRNSCLVRCNMTNAILLLGTYIPETPFAYCKGDTFSFAIVDALKIVAEKVSVFDVAATVAEEASSFAKSLSARTNTMSDDESNMNVVYAVFECNFKCYLTGIHKLWTIFSWLLEKLQHENRNKIRQLGVMDTLLAQVEDFYKHGSRWAAKSNTISSSLVPLLSKTRLQPDADVLGLKLTYHIAQLHFFFGVLTANILENAALDRDKNNKSSVAWRLSNKNFIKCGKLCDQLLVRISPNRVNQLVDIFVETLLLEIISLLLLESSQLQKDLPLKANCMSTRDLFSWVASNLEAELLRKKIRVFHSRLAEKISFLERSIASLTTPCLSRWNTSEHENNSIQKLIDCCGFLVKSLIFRLSKSSKWNVDIERLKGCYRQILLISKEKSLPSVLSSLECSLVQVTKCWSSAH